MKKAAEKRSGAKRRQYVLGQSFLVRARVAWTRICYGTGYGGRLAAWKHGKVQTLSIWRFDLALAATSALTYLACVAMVAVVPQETVAWLFNVLLHGMDVGPVMRSDIPAREVGGGVLLTFVLAWLFGAAMAITYNAAGSLWRK